MTSAKLVIICLIFSGKIENLIKKCQKNLEYKNFHYLCGIKFELIELTL